MKKALTIFLLASLLAQIACGSSGQTTETPVSDGVSSIETTADPDVLLYGYVAPDLPDGLDYNGETFCIAYPEWSTYNSYFWAESLNGEVVNDACFKRISTVEEALNIDITEHSYGYVNDMAAFVEKTVMAGSDEYDLLMTHNYMGNVAIVSNGYVLDWNDISTVDMSKPYYNQTIIENYSIDGVLPFLSSDFLLPDINAIFFNSDMLASLKLENPYALVKSGGWTLDKLAEMSKAATRDLDGNGTMDDKDQYGFAGENGWQIVSVVTAGGAPIAEREGNNIRIAVADERCVDIVDKMRAFMYDSGNAFVWVRTDANDPNAGGTPPVNFADGKTLFYQAPLSYFEYMRSAEADYGILPYPKFDGSEEEYYSLNWAGYMSVMKTVSDTELVGYVVELLSSESCRTVLPAFFDELLGEKIARDEDAVEVLNMMFENTVCDVGLLTRTFSLLSSPFSKPEVAYMSHVESNLATFEKEISDYLAGCEAMKNG